MSQFALGAIRGAEAVAHNKQGLMAENLLEDLVGTAATPRFPIEAAYIDDYRGVNRKTLDELFGSSTMRMLVKFTDALESTHRTTFTAIARHVRQRLEDPSMLPAGAPQSIALDVSKGAVLEDPDYRAAFMNAVLRPAMRCILAGQRAANERKRLRSSRGARFAKEGLGNMLFRSRLTRIPASGLKSLTQLADESDSGSEVSSADSSDSESYAPKHKGRGKRGKRAGKKPQKAQKHFPGRCWNKRCKNDAHHYKDCPHRQQNEKKNNAKHDKATREGGDE